MAVYKKDLEKHFKNIDEKRFFDEINSYQKEVLPFLTDFSNNEHYFDDILPKFIKHDKKEINLRLWKAFSEIITYGGIGIVIAGFDEEFHFGSFTNFNMILNNIGKIEIEEIETKINIKEPLIRVYATTSGADLFLNGIDNRIEKKLINILINENNLNEIDVKDSIDTMKKEFKDSIQNSIEWLPKKERIELNHTLIYLTALKQKISPNIETVGGNIRSCILEKDKEFRWIN